VVVSRFSVKVNIRLYQQLGRDSVATQFQQKYGFSGLPRYYDSERRNASRLVDWLSRVGALPVPTIGLFRRSGISVLPDVSIPHMISEKLVA
jgi:hypothetical protein